MKRLCVAVLCLLACACQSTSFQTPPLAAEPGCDPALVGHWASVNQDGSANDEMHLSITADCHLSVTDTDKGTLRRGESTLLHLARATGRAYAWVSAGWADLRFEAADDLRTDPGDIYLFRYQVQGDELSIDFVDHKAVAHLIIDGKLPGTVRSDDQVLVNRITGPARPEILAEPGLFNAEPSRFRREAGTP